VARRRDERYKEVRMLAPERRRSFLTAEDKFVRDAVAGHFGRSYSRDPDLIGLVLDACDTYGDRNNRDPLEACSHFIVTPSSLDRVLQYLERTEDVETAAALNEVVIHAPVEMVSKCAAAIRANPKFEPDSLVRLERRLDLASWTSERLWHELQDHAKRAETEWDREGFDAAYADDLLDALLDRDIPSTATICDMLRSWGRNEWNGWLEIWLVDLAGKRRLRKAVPLIVDKLHVDSDFLLEAADRALPRIGDPDASRLICAAYPTSADYFRIYSSYVLGNIPHPDSEDALMTLVEVEKDRGQRP
jgi:hypothetical protein